LYAAILEKELHQYDSAIKHLQQAIIHLSASNFSDTSISSNPLNFSATFTSYKLFEALVEKGMVLNEIYRSSRRVNDLLHSLAAFESAIGLVNYIGQSYDTDEARLFIKNNTQKAFQGAFRICMQLATLFPDKIFLEKGFLILEKNKASVLAGGVRENRLKKEYGIDHALLQEEQKVKLEIAKLNQQAEITTEDSVMARIDAARRDQEIKLSQLQKLFEKNPSYRTVKYEEEQPGTDAIRKLLLPEEVVISYAISDSILHAFVVDHEQFHYVQLGEMNSVSIQVEALVAALKKVESGYRYKTNSSVVELYNRLLLPLLPYIKEKKEMIIIPDGILYFLPFEVLQPAAEEKPLLFTKTISYHFSTRLLSKSNEQPAQDYEVLGIAPFAAGNAQVAGSMLPFSGEELKDLRGNIFMNEQAVKDRFTDAANHFPVVHLATHALAQTVNPSGSYIAFYPTGTEATGRLYLDELYGLQLDSVRLVIMSACETGEGKLVDGEGVMSLSRGFAYAGAQSIVTSFWKADDQSTAFIIKKFHEYIREGKKKSAALQQAKIDYLRSDALHKTPNYWAHLVLVGDPSPIILESSSIWPWLAPIGFLVIGILLGRRKKSGSNKK
jgi:CHAT domain-containing protein